MSATKNRGARTAAIEPGALSRPKLLGAWDEQADPFTQTVKITISRLRAKLATRR